MEKDWPMLHLDGRMGWRGREGGGNLAETPSFVNAYRGILEAVDPWTTSAGLIWSRSWSSRPPPRSLLRVVRA